MTLLESCWKVALSGATRIIAKLSKNIPFFESSPITTDNHCLTELFLSVVPFLLQIDAAINSGNSGGPALQDDKVIGIAFETLDNAENIGYIIPVGWQECIYLFILFYFVYTISQCK